MKARGLGRWMGAVAALVLAGVGGPRSTRAEPESPSLWDAIRAADSVVLARVTSMPVAPEPVIGPDAEAEVRRLPPDVVQRVEGLETWKGRRFESLERRIPFYEDDGGCVPGRTVVAFLRLENGALSVVSCLYGDRELDPESVTSLRKQIRRAVSLQDRESPEIRERVDWLVEQAEIPETRAAALYELCPEGNREAYADERFLREPLAPSLSISQIDRIARAFVRSKPADVSLPSFLLILEDRPSRSIDDAALAAIEAAMAAEPIPPEWLTDAMGLVLDRFGDRDGRVRARLLPENGVLDMQSLRDTWASARRDLGIPDAPREPPRGEGPGVPAAPAAAPPEER